jgi:DNA-binding transcriptional MerR regulator
MVEGYPTLIATRVTGTTLRMATYWVEVGLLTPSVLDGSRGRRRGSKQGHLWSFRDLVALRTVGELRQAGVSLQDLRKVSGYLHDYGGDFADTFLVAVGDDVMIVTGAELISTLKAPGQLVIKAMVYDLSRAEREVRSALAELAMAA